MKKYFWILLLSSFSWGATTITSDQALQALKVKAQVYSDNEALGRFAQQVYNILNNGSQYSVDFSTTPVSLTPDQVAGLINRYQQLKAQVCQVDCAAFP